MKKFLVALLLVFVLSFSGCAKRVESSAGQATPFQKAVAYNTALADTNKAVAQSVIVLNSSNVIADDNTASVLGAQKKIAQVDLQISQILNQGETYSISNSVQLFSLINQISDAAKKLESDGVLPNDPKAQALQANIDSLISIANNLVLSLKAAGIN